MQEKANRIEDWKRMYELIALQAKAFRIVDWQEKYELTRHSSPANENTQMENLQKSPFPYIRIKGGGHMLDPVKRRMYKLAWNFGDNVDMKCWGLYISLLDLARDQEREKRGWILDDRQLPINPVQIAEVLGIQDANINLLFEILISGQVNWVEFVDFPEALQNNTMKTQNDNLGKPNGSPPNSLSTWESTGESGKAREPFLNVTETKLNQEENETERNLGKLGSEGESGGAGGGEENVQPQALPAAQASVSVSVPASASDSAPVSASERTSVPVSGSDSVPVSDSVSQPGPRAGPGAGCEDEKPLSEGDKFKIRAEARDAKDDAISILGIDRHNKSDMTTMMDIYDQLANKVIGGSPYPLFEFALNKARACPDAFNTPIAGFIEAMKKPPFKYVPKRRTVIPDKYRRDKNTNRYSQERRTQNE